MTVTVESASPARAKRRRGPGAARQARRAGADDRVVRRRNAAVTRGLILEAAMEEFATRGLPHARIEDIALRAGANRRMIYYYFGSKEGLYLAALEAVYAQLVEEERKIDVEKLDPVAAIAELVRLKIEHYTNYPHFITFLNMENLYQARYLKKS